MSDEMLRGIRSPGYFAPPSMSLLRPKAIRSPFVNCTTPACMPAIRPPVAPSSYIGISGFVYGFSQVWPLSRLMCMAEPP